MPLVNLQQLAIADHEHKAGPSKTRIPLDDTEGASKKKFFPRRKSESAFAIEQGETAHQEISSDEEPSPGVVITDLGNGDCSGNE